MNVLLTTSPAPAKSPFFCNEKRFPLGVGFLLSVLRRAGHKVYFIDNFLKLTRFWEDDFLMRKEIDFVGIYASTICFNGTKEIISGCDGLRKSGRWRGKIMVGGPHTSVDIESIPPAVDFIVRGEGEHAILDIVEDRALTKIVDGKRVEKLDELPPPAYDIFANHQPPYENTVECFPDNPVFTMNTSRGCPYTCKFCSVQGVWGRKYRMFSAERVYEDIKWLQKDFGVKGIYFREDNFTASLPRVDQFCEKLLMDHNQIKWLCETRVKPLPKEILKTMARAGCKWLYLGCESGSQRVLDKIDKRITVDDIRNVINWCKELGIKCYTSWIIGTPGEEESDRAATFSLIDELKPFSAGIHVFIGLPGSVFYHEMLNNRQYVYKDDLGLLYSSDWNKLAIRLPAYLAEDKFCPSQTLPFRFYKKLVQYALKFGEKYPPMGSILKKCSRSEVITACSNQLVKLFN